MHKSILKVQIAVFLLLGILLSGTAFAQNLVLEDVTITDEQVYSAESITVGPNFTVASTGKATLHSKTLAIRAEFFVIAGGSLNTITDTPPTSIKQKEVVILPENFLVHQNYPNPFNPQTSIVFELPKNTNVNISIFNVLGQKVKTLVNSQYGAGVHTVRWNGKDKNNNQVASGLYLYKIQTGNYKKVMKMNLTR
jgi:hypothetical protein